MSECVGGRVLGQLMRVCKEGIVRVHRASHHITSHHITPHHATWPVPSVDAAPSTPPSTPSPIDRAVDTPSRSIDLSASGGDAHRSSS